MLEVVPSGALDLVEVWASDSRVCTSHRRNAAHHRNFYHRLNASADYEIVVDGARDESGDRRVERCGIVVLRVGPLHPKSAASPSYSAGVWI